MLSLELQIHLHSLLILISVAFSCGLCISVWRAHANTASAGRLILLALLTVIAILALAYVANKEFNQWQNITYCLISLQMALGPLVYLYANYQTQPNFRWRPLTAIHFLPTFLMAGLWLWQIPLVESSILFVEPTLTDYPRIQGHRFWHRIFVWLSLIGYPLYTLKLLHPHETNMKQLYSELSPVNLEWLKALAWSLLVIILISLSADLSRMFGIKHYINGGHFQALGPVVVVFIISKYGLSQQDVYPKKIEKDAIKVPFEEKVKNKSIVKKAIKEKAQDKYVTSSLTAENAAILWQKLNAHMKQSQPYLEAGLKISELAQQLDTSVNHLSETINGYANSSYYDYVNRKRVEEAQRLLQDISCHRLSILDIGFHSGFNSNSTFYSHFKRISQVTPSQYRERNSLAINQ